MSESWDLIAIYLSFGMGLWLVFYWTGTIGLTQEKHAKKFNRAAASFGTIFMSLVVILFWPAVVVAMLVMLISAPLER